MRVPADPAPRGVELFSDFYVWEWDCTLLLSFTNLSCTLTPPLLLGVHSVRLLTSTTSLQRGPLKAPIAPVACS